MPRLNVSSSKPRKPQAARPTVDCFAAPAVVMPEGEIPNRIMIAPWGTRETSTGPVTVNAATAVYLARHQKHPFDTICLDFCHNTEKGDQSEPKAVAAYGKPELVAGEGLFLTAMEWTPDGEKAWKGRWYKDVSPMIARDKNGVVMFAKSAALCRNGRIPNLENFDAEEIEPSYPMKKSLILQVLNNAGANLPEDATDEAIAAAADQLAEGKSTSSTEAMSAEVTSAIKAALEPFQAELKTVKDSLAAQTAGNAKSEKQAIIDQAARDGQVIPFSTDDIMAETFSVDILRKCVAGLAKSQVPFKSTTSGAKSEPVKMDAFSAEDRAIAALLGVRDADLETYGGLPDKITQMPVRKSA